MSLQPGTYVGRFRVERLIAQGGMAEVYRAEQELAGGILRPAAVKVIRPEYSESPDFREMFLDEARLACTLSHPNIVHIYEVGESDGRLYMAMELVPGDSLAHVARTLRDRGERLSDEALIAVGIYTCSALEAVHALRLPGKGHLNLVHRDVSPHNLLLGPTGSLKLIDFGIAKAASNRNLTSPGVTKGKAGYFSPEQAMGKALDGRSDLFSLGVTLYKLAWGGTPFDQYRTHHERNTALVHGRWHPLRAVCPGLPDGFYDIVDRALALAPQDRFADAAEMRLALERLALESGFTVGPSTLAGYVAFQDDDPMALGTRALPSSARHARPAALQSTAHAATGAQVTREAPAATTPDAPRRTERLAARTPARTSATGERSRRRWMYASGISAAVITAVAGLIVGERAARDASAPAAPPAEAAAPVLPSQPPPAPRPAQADADAPTTASARAPQRLTEDLLTGPEETSRPVRTPSRVRTSPRSTKREARTALPGEPKAAVAAPTAPQNSGMPGKLRVGPGDGLIEVNGRRMGKAPQDLSLPPGTYSVVVKSPDGRERVNRTVEIRSDAVTPFFVDFSAPAQRQ